ncbi:MAG: GuaB3 family IMP dehydrogenase-related protein [Acidimicrobiales bacterium]
MADVEIGIGKAARRAYSLDEITIVPSRRTRDSADVDISWQLEAFSMPLPLMAAPADSVVSPLAAFEIGRLGGIAVLDLEGLWTRHEDPEGWLEQIAAAPEEELTSVVREAYSAPVKSELVARRVSELSEGCTVACGSVSPKRAAELAPAAVAAGLDVLVIRASVVSAEHVRKSGEALDMNGFIRSIDLPVVIGGCASHQTALHLMRAGAAGVLVGGGEISTTRGVLGVGVPQATALADAAGARTRHLEETGAYVHVIADGGLSSGGDVAKAFACGADAVMLGAPLAAAAEAPGGGTYFDRGAAHDRLPESRRVPAPCKGSLEEILLGPGREGDGRLNLFGALRASMATSGYATIREFHKAEVVVSSPNP